jgi:threonyl-tRNA synthetase
MKEEEQKIYWHSTAHILAMAVKSLFPDVKLAIGPAIDNGFYYDFDSKKPFTPEDLGKIEKRMGEIIKKDIPFVREEVKKEDAIKYFTKKGEKYKLELLEGLGDTVTFYKNDNFVDLCKGPHVSSTGKISAFKLTEVAGAYWRGDEKREMLQRIYGVSYKTKKELEDYLKKIQEAKERDHRKLGKELELYGMYEEIGPGLPLWWPKGAIIYKIIEDFWVSEHMKRGYELVKTPHIARSELWKISGHYDYYREYMATLNLGKEEYVLKPMNCPFHILIYKSKRRSYRELPIRYAELGTVYRYEKAGVLHGLMRVRGFTQDDAHIFCRRDQVKEEIIGCINIAQYMLKTFGFMKYNIELSVREPQEKDKYAGADEDWEEAEKSLIDALEEKNLGYKRMEGEAVFYGPKIDIKIVDAIGRPWQATTIQFDFNLPKRFGVTYIGKDNIPHQCIMIHRALLGSMERFFGCLIEHYKGAFPFWLSPHQVTVATLSDSCLDYGEKVANILRENGFRTHFDNRNEKLGLKIREASIEKVPYIIIIGDREKKTSTISVRERGKGDIGKFEIDKFLAILEKRERDRR